MNQFNNKYRLKKRIKKDFIVQIANTYYLNNEFYVNVGTIFVKTVFL